MTTISDVAQHAGVSTATVSRVVNMPEVVSADTRAVVEAAIYALDYRPNRAAQTLKLRSSQTVGMVVNRFSSPYFGGIIEGVEDGLRPFGFKTIAEAGHETASGQLGAWMSLVGRQCESCVVHADAVDEVELRNMMHQYPKTVLINRDLPGFQDRCVRLDNLSAGKMAAEYLLAQGHRKIAMIGGPKHLHEIKDRGAGFLERLSQDGIRVRDSDLFVGQLMVKHGATSMAQLIESKSDVTAIFCHNDLIAAGAIELCRTHGIDVPADISIIGFDDLSIAEHLHPKLTTVRQPMHRIGAAAGALAFHLARNPDACADIQNIFEAEVVVRASVRTI